MRLSRLPAALALAALLAAAAPPARGDFGGLDLSEVRSHVATGDAQGFEGAVGRAYTRLLRRLDSSAAGPRADFGRLSAAARECAGPLSGDFALGQSVSEALEAARVGLRTLDAEVVGMAGDVVHEGRRAGVLAIASRGRARQRAGENMLYLADEPGAGRAFRAAAGRLLRARSRAQALIAGQVPDHDEWRVALSGRAGALLGVWGEPGPDARVFAVGAEDAEGPQFLVRHPGAEGWVRVPVAASGDLWWVTHVPGGGAWACGSAGRVVQYDPAAGTLVHRSTGLDTVLYGIWGASPDEVWAVGGDPAAGGPTPTLVRWDGANWYAAEVPAAAAGKILYKVWGAAADDVWAVGEGGLLLHWDGDAWTEVPSGTTSVLLTVHGSGSTVVAVGGGASAVAVERGQDGTWAPVPVYGATGGTGSQFPGGAVVLNGVSVGPAGESRAVGLARTVERRGPSAWNPISGVPAAVRDLHAVWTDDEGNSVMVGGRLSNRTEGILVTYGRRTLPSVIAPRAKWLGDVADLLYSTCAHSGCHLPPFANAGFLVDGPAFTHAQLVDVPATQAPLLRVKAGRPSNSYLWHKLLGTHETVGGTGARMPELHDQYTEFFTPEQMERVRGWILDGARDD